MAVTSDPAQPRFDMSAACAADGCPAVAASMLCVYWLASLFRSAVFIALRILWFFVMFLVIGVLKYCGVSIERNLR